MIDNKKKYLLGNRPLYFYGKKYFPQEPITIDLITGKNSYLIKPRVLRSKDEKSQRTKEKAEVFTPSWVCNKQNNLIDENGLEGKIYLI